MDVSALNWPVVATANSLKFGFPAPPWDRKGREGGFSLTELLLVVAVMAILMTGVANLFSGFRGTDQKKALVDIANAVELARQVSVSKNTYTYVGFTTPTTPHDAGAPLCVAVFQSSAGDDVVRRSLLAGDLLPPEISAGGQDGWSLIAKPQWLRNAVIDHDSGAMGDLSELAPALALSQNTISHMTASSQGTAFEISRKVGDMPTKGALRFDRLITFCPNGAAIVDNERGLPASTIGFLIRPSRSSSPSDHEKAQSAAVLVSGLMGNVQIHQR